MSGIVFALEALEKLKDLTLRVLNLEQNPGGGGQIADGETSTTKTWSSNKISGDLAGKAATVHTHLWADITDKPSTFTPAAHTHTIANVTGLPDELNARRRERTITGAAITTVVAAGTDSNAHVVFVANTVSGNVAIPNPTSGNLGQVITWIATTSGTGQITFGTAFRRQFGVTPVVYADGQLFAFSAQCDGTNWLINWSTY